MSEVHDIIISHQTVANYMERLNENYKYNLSDKIAGDETYIKVLGKNQYVFFFSDTVKKIITSYRIHPNRTTKNAVIAVSKTSMKFYP